MEKLLEQIITIPDLDMAAKTCTRLLLAVILGGFIGNEREHINRPAGIRTHILVCVGAALVMMTSEFVTGKYAGVTNVDSTRLGAQVISGIGFLGAGTIIKEGFSVKGLTTAASLWTVSCVGLAVGGGFYFGAIVATFLVFLTLQFFKKVSWRRTAHKQVNVKLANDDFSIYDILKEFNRLSIQVNSTEIAGSGDNSFLELHMSVVVPGNRELLNFAVDHIKTFSGVDGVHME